MKEASRFAVPVVWDRRKADAGRVAMGGPVTAEFGFTNGTSGSLTLEAAACCGSRFRSSPVTVRPGEHGTIRISTTASRLSGERRQSFVVRAKELKTYETTLAVSYLQPGRWWPVPPILRLGRLAEGTVCRRRLLIFRDRGLPALEAIRPDSSRISTHRMHRSAEDCEEFAVTYTTPIGQHGPFEHSLRLQPPRQSAAEVVVPLRGVIDACAAALPPSLLLGEIPVGASAMRTVQVSSRTPMRGVEVRARPQWLSVKLRRRRASRRALLACTTTVSRPGAFCGTLTLRVVTNHAFDIEVPVTGYATPRPRVGMGR